MGQMASIQEQLKQIRAASDDWYDEHRRYVSHPEDPDSC